MCIRDRTIVIPKEHYQFIFQIPDYILWNIFRVVKIIEPFIVNVSKAGGVTIIINQGKDSGQLVPHFSVNIIPRYEGDKASFYWERKKADKESLESFSKVLRESIEKSLEEEKRKTERKLKESFSIGEINKAKKEPEKISRRKM